MPLFLSFFLSLSVAGKKEELKQLYIYLKRALETLSNALSLFVRAKRVSVHACKKYTNWDKNWGKL